MQQEKSVSDSRQVSVEDWLRAIEEQAGVSAAAHNVVQAAIQDPKHASFSSTSEMAKAAGVNVATVTRTAQTLGFSGWPELREAIRARYLGNLSAPDLAAVHRDDNSANNAFDKALNHSLDQLLSLRRRVDRQTVREIAKSIAGANRRLVIGSGSFTSIAEILSHHATLSGYRMDIATDGVSIANAMGDIGKGDVVVILTFWRLYNTALRAAASARSRGATVCVITDANVEQLAFHANHMVIVPADSTSFFTTVLPAMTVIEGLAAELAALDPKRSHDSIESFEREWLSQDLLYYRIAPMEGKEY